MKKTIFLCAIMLMSIGSVSAEGKFYLYPSVEQWGQADAVFGATFKDASGNESGPIHFVSTEINPYIYELDIPDGDWTQIMPRRYAPNWEVEYGSEVGYLTYGTNNFIIITGWAGTNLSTYTPPVLSDTKFYLDITGSDWAPLADSFYKAIFQDVSSAIYEVVFKPTTVSSIYKVNVPVGNITQVRVERYLIQTQASSGGDQGKDYLYGGTLNCATVTGWFLDDALTTYTPTATSTKLSEFVLNVYTLNNQIIATFEGATRVELYTTTGQVLYKGQANSSFVYSVPQGVYLLRINGQTHKVLVK